MDIFTGHFFCVTKYSMYRITVPEDLRSRPEVEKRSTHTTSWELGRDMHIPVGGTFRNGHHVAITSRGLFQYHMPPGHNGPPLPFEQVPGVFRAKCITQTTLIAGLFLGWREAEECFGMMPKLPKQSFPPLWHGDTKKTLVHIGVKHPLVVISTGLHDRFGVPQYLWNPALELPFFEK